MHSIVKTLRIRGKRKADREIQSEPGVKGDISLAAVATSYELQLCRPNDSTMQRVLPTLYEARLITMGSSRMLFRGLERGPDGAEWVQEWSVMLLRQ